MTAERGRRASILIVDDTVDNLQLMTAMLTQQGYEARPVPSGKLALQAVANDPPDLILLDITMPGMSGYEVCERLKAEEQSKDIPGCPATSSTRRASGSRTSCSARIPTSAGSEPGCATCCSSRCSCCSSRRCGASSAPTRSPPRSPIAW
jgi:CheY-like chemotaxis protein